MIVLTCLTTATVALFCSVLFRKTATSMMTSYLIIGGAVLPAAGAAVFRAGLFPAFARDAVDQPLGRDQPDRGDLRHSAELSDARRRAHAADSWNFFFSYLAFTSALDLMLLAAIIWLFNTRWRVAE